jgi:hypothetical protein
MSLIICIALPHPGVHQVSGQSVLIMLPKICYKLPACSFSQCGTVFIKVHNMSVRSVTDFILECPSY